jgi:BlaI family transcriptional regulator, penicillinase repressor
MAKRGRRRKKGNELSDMELDVMGVVWDLGECTSAEIIAEYGKKRSLAETTIRTVLSNLRKKGFLELVPTVERTYVYRSAVSRESVARGSLRALVGRLFGGSPREAIAYLIEDEDWDESEFEAIRRIVKSRQGDKRNER